MPHIKLIEKQHLIFRLQIDQVTADLHAKPLALYTDGLMPLPAKVEGSTLGWNVGGKFVTYNQIKKYLAGML